MNKSHKYKKQHIRIVIRNLILDGYTVYVDNEDPILCSIENIKGCLFIKKKYQVDSKSLKFSQLYSNLDDAITQFFKLKKNKGIKIAVAKTVNKKLSKV